jgi:hypothetical protein
VVASFKSCAAFLALPPEDIMESNRDFFYFPVKAGTAHKEMFRQIFNVNRFDMFF